MFTKKAFAMFLFAPCLMLGLACSDALAAEAAQYEAQSFSWIHAQDLTVEKAPVPAILILAPNGSFEYVDLNGLHCSGDYAQPEKGMHMKFFLSKKAKNDMSQLLKEWLVEAAAEKKMELIVKSLDFIRVEMSAAPRANGEPQEVLIKVKFKVKGRINGKATAFRATHKCKIRVSMKSA